MQEQKYNPQKQEKQEQQRQHGEFNSITQKVKVENQNQKHNSRLEGTHPTNNLN